MRHANSTRAWHSTIINISSTCVLLISLESCNLLCKYSTICNKKSNKLCGPPAVYMFCCKHYNPVIYVTNIIYTTNCIYITRFEKVTMDICPCSYTAYYSDFSVGISGYLIQLRSLTGDYSKCTLYLNFVEYLYVVFRNAKNKQKRCIPEIPEFSDPHQPPRVR